jgi:HSP20 family protein
VPRRGAGDVGQRAAIALGRPGRPPARDGAHLRVAGAAPGLAAPRVFPPINVHDHEGAYVLTAEVPGLEPADVEISLTGDTLVLRGERRPDRNVPDEAYRRQERPFGTWSRTYQLPGKIDADRVSATLSRGVLTVVLPRVENPRTRSIPILPGPA